MFRNLPTLLLFLSFGLLLSGAVAGGAEGGNDDAAVIAKQLPTYPLKTCVVTGEGLDSMGKPYDYVYKGRLIRLCCKGCVKKVNADPDKYLKILDEAEAKAKAGGEEKTEAKTEGK